MPQNKKVSGTLVYSIITVLLLIIFVFPIPSVLLDFLIAVNLALSALFILDVHVTKTNKGFLSFSKQLLIFVILNFAINVIVTRYLLTYGDEFESMLIRFASSPMAGNKIAIFAASIFFTASIVVYFIIITKMINKVSETAVKFSSDNMPEKMAMIESEQNAGAITAEQAEEKKDCVKYKTEFFCELNNVCKYLSWYERLRFVFVIVNSAVGYFIGKNVRGEMKGDAFETYFSLTVSSGFLSLLSAVLLAVSLSIVLKRFEHA